MANGKAKTSKSLVDEIKELKREKAKNFGIGRQTKGVPASVGVPLGASGSKGGTDSNDNQLSYIKTAGDTMVGPLAFYPIAITMSDNYLQVSEGNGFSSRLIVTGEGSAADDIVSIVGAAHAGQILFLQATETTDITLKDRAGSGTAWATSTAYVAGDIRANGGLLYVCHTGHTSSASDEPGVGANWEDYWYKGNVYIPSGNDYVVSGKEIVMLQWDTINETWTIVSNFNDGAGGGGSQTPWTSNIDADGFDLQDLSNIEFRETTGVPASTSPSIYHEAAGITLNVPSGDIFSIDIAGTPEYEFSASGVDVKDNTIDNVSSIQITDASSNVHGLLAGVTATGVRMTLTAGEMLQIYDNVTSIVNINTASGVVLNNVDLTMGTGNIIAGGDQSQINNIGELHFDTNTLTPAPNGVIYFDGTDLKAKTGSTTVNLTNIGGSNFTDAVFRVTDELDTTKKFAVDVTSNFTGTTATLAFGVTADRTITFPDATTTLPGLSTTHTWTGGNTWQSTSTFEDDITVSGTDIGLVNTGKVEFTNNGATPAASIALWADATTLHTNSSIDFLGNDIEGVDDIFFNTSNIIITSDAAGMTLQVPTGDTIDFLVNGSRMTLSETAFDVKVDLELNANDLLTQGGNINTANGTITTGTGQITGGGTDKGIDNVSTIEFTAVTGTPAYAAGFYSIGNVMYMRSSTASYNLENIASSTFTDAVFRVQDELDATKEFIIDVTGNFTGTTATLDFNTSASRIYTFPDVTGEVLTTTGVQSITGAKDFTDDVTFGGAGFGADNAGFITFVANGATPAAALAIYGSGSDLVVSTGGGSVNLSNVFTNPAAAALDMNNNAIDNVANIDFGTGSADTGLIRLPNTASIEWESAPASAYHGEIEFDVDEKFLFTTPASGAFTYWIGDAVKTQVLEINSSGIDLQGNSITNGSMNVSLLTGILGIANGGTGNSTNARGDILYAPTANTWSRLPVGTSGQFLKSDGTDISWSNHGLGINDLSDVVITSPSASQVLTYNGSAWVNQTATDSTEFADDVFRITGSVTASKKLAFEVDGLTTSTTRTITMPDANVNLGALTNDNLAGGVFSSILGVGVQSQALNMSNNAINNFDYLEANGTAATAGAIRLVNNTNIAWDNVGTGNSHIELDASDNFNFVNNSVDEFTIDTSNNEVDLHSNHLKLANAGEIRWESSPAGTDVTMTVNASEYIILGGSIAGFDFGGGVVQNGAMDSTMSAASVGVTSGFLYTDGIKQTFNPNGTNAGINVGAHTANPSSPAEGDIYFNSTGGVKEFRGYDGTAWVDLGQSGGGSQTPWTSDIDADGFDLTDMGRLEYRGGIGFTFPADNAVLGIAMDTANMEFNVATGDGYLFFINGTQTFGVGASTTDVHAGNFEVSAGDINLIAGDIDMNQGYIQFDATTLPSNPPSTETRLTMVSTLAESELTNQLCIYDQNQNVHNLQYRVSPIGTLLQTISNSNNNDWDFVHPINAIQDLGNGIGVAQDEDTLFFYPFYVANPIFLHDLGCYVTTGGTFNNYYKLSIYSNKAGYNYPDSKIAEATTINPVGNGYSWGAINTRLENGVYWVGFLMNVNDTDIRFFTLPGKDLICFGYYDNGASSSPATGDSQTVAFKKASQTAFPTTAPDDLLRVTSANGTSNGALVFARYR